MLFRRYLNLTPFLKSISNVPLPISSESNPVLYKEAKNTANDYAVSKSESKYKRFEFFLLKILVTHRFFF